MISLRRAVQLVAPFLACAPLPALAQEMQFNVPMQPAITGIPEFARQAGIQIVAPVSQLRNEKTRTVRGRYGLDAALRLLLRGTGLRVIMRTGNIVSLGPARQSMSRPPTNRPERPVPPRTRPALTEEEGQPPVLQEIIVTGTRDRLSPTPQDEKRNAMGFVSAVGSTEIAQRTDVSVAAASLRLPGVVLSRGTQTAQAWYPAIRGFDGRYSSVTLDGSMLYLSTRNQRGVPLDFLPASAINEIVINKTVTPEMDPNSIGGHIEIKTLGVFDNDGKPLTTLDAQAVNYTRPGSLSSGNPSYKISGVVKRTFGIGGNYGFALGGSVHKDQFNEIINSTTALLQQDGVDIPSGNLLTGNYDRRQRGASLMGKFEGRGDRWHGYVAANYFSEHIREDLSRSNVSIVPALVTDAAGGTGRFTGATPGALSNFFFNDRTVASFRTGAEYQTSGNAKIIFNASFLNVDYKEQFWTGAPLAGPMVSGSYTITDRMAASHITGPASLSDPAQWTQGSDVTATQPIYPLTDKTHTARVEFSSNNFSFSRGPGYDVGIDFRRLHRVLDQSTYNYVLPAGTTISLSQVLKPGSTFVGADPGKPIFVDVDRYWNLVSSLANRSLDPGLTADYDLREDVIAPFLSLYYTTNRFRILAGVRYNIVRYTDSSHRIVDGSATPFTISRNLPYLLPNLQGYYDISSGMRFRAAFTETMALQDFSNFANGRAVGYDYKGNPVINNTNPYLRPRRSFNKDLSVELYRPSGYFSLGYFHKTIVDEVQVVTQFQYDTNGLLTQTIQNPINGGGENSQGVEFEAQWRDFSGLALWLRGVTLDVNGAWFDSETEILMESATRRIIDGLRLQPKWVANLALSYNRKSFSAAILGMVRGRALAGIGSTPANDIYIAPFATLDAKFGYRLGQNVKLYVEGRNLTDYWYREVTGISRDKVSTAIKDGPTFVVGATLDF